MCQEKSKIDNFEKEVISSLGPTEIQRYKNIKKTLWEWRHLFANRYALDFGSGYDLSISALIFNGASFVIGIEPDKEKVIAGESMLKKAGLEYCTKILHVEETMLIPYYDNNFDFVLANGVIEHIPVRRDIYLKEIWRLVSIKGHIMISETPNKYFPKEIHTTNLWFNHWLPEKMAYERAIRKKRFFLDRNA